MARPRKAGPAAIRIRMYRIGFGDCFLLTFPGPTRDHHVLVDCGVHPRGNIRTMEAVVDDLLEVTGSHIDIVIATHAHQDHIAGFGSCAARFSRCSAGEVWLPWSEDPSNERASAMRGRRQETVSRLTQHFAALGGSQFGAVEAALQNLAGNDVALRTLRTGFRGARVRYLVKGEDQQDAAGVPGLLVRVLGPGTDEAFLRQMDPPAKQRYLRAAPGGTEVVGGVHPFAKCWIPSSDRGPHLSRRDRKLLSDIASDPTAGLAFTLDQAVNNTSLVTLFEFRGRSLLFPGDAQYGNWRNWIDAPGADALLSQVDFYKVSHHGSVNATPKAALEKMPSASLAAMVSTQSEPWSSIPEGRLMDALARKAGRGIVRSDSLPVNGGPRGPRRGRLPRGFSSGPFWFDYTLPLEA